MFWIGLEMSNPKMVLFARLSLLVKNWTAFRNDAVVKSGNIAGGRAATFPAAHSKQFLRRNDKAMSFYWKQWTG